MHAPFAIGIVLSAVVAVFARIVGLDRDRAFYPTVMIVVASYYVLFAAISGSVQTMAIESVELLEKQGGRSGHWVRGGR